MSAKPKHCRLFGWNAGNCGMLHCARCGQQAYANLRRRIVAASLRQPSLIFVTIYYDSRHVRDMSDLPLFADHRSELEHLLRRLISKVFRALRDKARRLGCRFEYVVVLALSKVKHRVHKVMHAHALVTWLPDVQKHRTSRRKERLECQWLEKKLADLHLVAWIEKPRSNAAVARYTAENLRTVIGKKEYKNVRIYRFSQGYEQ